MFNHVLKKKRRVRSTSLIKSTDQQLHLPILTKHIPTAPLA